MWERIIGWIKGALGLNRKDIEQITDSLVTSPPMWEALREWSGAFYNKPPWDKECKQKSTRFPGLVTGYAATLCAAELKLSSGSGARADWVQQQIERFVLPDMRNTIQKATALSFVAMKPCPDTVSGDIYCEVVAPDSFFPTDIKGGRIMAGIFVDMQRVKQNGKETAYVRLEEHQWQNGAVFITNKAYRAEKIKPGAEVPLDVIAGWANLAQKANIPTDRPLFAILKMPFANQVDPHSDLPVSLYANAMDTFGEIDEKYNDFLWEVRSGRRKMFIDPRAVSQTQNTRPSDIRHYDTTDQFLMNMGPDPDSMFADYTPEMRVEEYQQGLNVLVRMLETQIGVSAGTFDFDIRSGVAKSMTATEVISNDSDTYQTIKAIQENGIKQGLIDLVHIYDTYATLYGVAPAGTVTPGVEFGDSIFEDTGTEFVRRKALVDAGYERPELFLAWYYGIAEEDAKKMMPEQAIPKPYYAPGEDGI